jgi:hypothetical protein
MSENFNTNEEETLNDEIRKTIRVEVEADYANAVLKNIDAPTPDASEIDEIVLVIKR